MIQSNGVSLLARISCSDVNTPGYDGLAFSALRRDTQFEVAAYEHLKDHPGHVLRAFTPHHQLQHPKTQGEAEVMRRVV